MINLAQSKRLDREFVLHGKFYAFDSTTIDLCLSLFQWAFCIYLTKAIMTLPDCT